ncbi:arginase family protein [Emticicia sp. 21SJ11W-3]|uniref:arginase family protein n=1 Tax=Emticicia sp. 21SJ11W-3 TaxID=2916755 RepID=UPI00209ED9DD|nr:arginase family protein [Emticicia sp. 21SJ11W-3]UTA67223.1 arginase family protein [Emticicia sp. 21SJ11W-3]
MSSKPGQILDKTLVFVTAPSNLGLKRMPYADKDGPGTRKMPGVFKQFLFAERLKIAAHIHIEPPAYSGKVDAETGIRNLPEILSYSKQYAAVIKSIVEKDQLPIVIGGDCSILVGSMLALKQSGTYGLAHIDGHSDYAIAKISSSTGGVAGMDLAIVTGIGPDAITNIDNLKPYVAEANTAQFANRCYDETFNGNFYNTNIFSADLPELRANGIEETANAFIAKLRKNKVDGLWLHVDADVLNEELMPAVDSPQEDGLSYAELKTLLKALLRSGLVCGFQLTIYDPDLDPGKVYGKKLVDELVDLFQQA